MESDWDGGRAIGPVIRVFSPASSDPAASAASGIDVDAPFKFKLVVELDPVIERFVRILDASGRLVTVIEFISPTNKSAQGLEAYREKRSDLLNAGVNLVEVDLVRRGDWRALMRPHVCPLDAVATYRRPCDPPLEGEEARLAEEILKRAGKRP